MKFHISYLSPVMLVAVLTPGVEDAPAVDGPPPVQVNVAAAAKRIDGLIESAIRRVGRKPNAMATDATFARRTYLGLTGRIPTREEATAFLNSQAPDKRAKLIDQLLDSPGYQSHMFNYWADLLRVKSRLNNQISGEPFMHYLKQSIADNKPFDTFVHEMVAAKGPAHARNNGATGLLLRDRGMPLDSMANIVRVFLGTRLECAQCHDHPFDKWKQKDFYQMAAYAGGISYRAPVPMQEAPGLAEVFRESRGNRRDRDTQRALGRLLRPVYAGVAGTGTGTIRLPKDYKYEDAKPRELVKAQVIFGKTPKIEYKKPKPAAKPVAGGKSKRDGKKTWRERQRERQAERRRLREMRQKRNRNRGGAVGINTRPAYAEWLTSPSNPRFTKVIANRMWKLAMGRALIEPVDNIMEKTKASNEPLMRYLEKLMANVDYDLKKFQRILYNTKTYQRQANFEEVPSDQTYLFEGPVLRRMTAEQVWDSMLTFVLPDVDKTLPAAGVRADFVYANYERIIGMSADELRAEVNAQKLRYTNPKKFREQAAAKRRAAQRKMAKARQAKNAAKQAKVRPLYREFAKARRAGDQQKMDEIKAQLAELGAGGDRMMGGGNRNRRGRGRGATQLVRASALRAPAPDGHFLRKFGQSDREQIQASHTEANVPQVLSLLNGFLDQRVLSSSRSTLMKGVYDAGETHAKVESAYLAILNRRPRGREAAVWAAEIDAGGRKVIKDLVWTLVNSHEFRFIQ